ncbi:2-amino-4-hydroxy-6-hydroxymethyldihydropteridine diphosphokinase [Entomomonas asaccharolytica]|uniref:2-amino-4-hydroxy-6- hydroxymethyldihydropteridine diphosphokinase n=1 Tax=Entomomonas asaccharolytica TaxID=2785331 RepID=UPI001F23A7FB|nr:2-amino-4-hydroxy-6-hydroxymethyldihydropteridine diphosphokinase [Entomomonas asaccharolytica]
MTKQLVYIGLGSNLQDPVSQLTTALTALANLPNTQLIKQSSLYISDSLVEGQPQYINAVACLETSLVPEVFLDYLQQIENKHGRVRTERWGARTLDLDIILYGNQQINTERLTIPHPQMALRSFVLIPLLEIAPAICLPDGRAVTDLLADCPSQNLQRLSS